MLSPDNDNSDSTKDENNSSVTGSKLRPKARRDNGDFSDPIFKKLSRLNGEINKMTKEELKEKLTSLRLDSSGIKDIMKRRLKDYYKKQSLMKAHIKPPGKTKFDYLIVIDYEATCMENNTNYKHEIIEFPGVLIDVEQIKVVDEFHSYCKPCLNSRLTEFCTQLTGITQEKVDEAPEFCTVLMMFEEWMSSHRLRDCYTVAIVTDGPWDMSRFLVTQCQLASIPYPKWAKKWINIRKLYANYYQCRRCKIEEMLSSLGMTFEGTLHCGLHDTRNIARIALRMLSDGCKFKLNEFVISRDDTKQVKAEVEMVASDDDEDTEHRQNANGEAVNSGVVVERTHDSVDSLSLAKSPTQSVCGSSSKDSELCKSMSALNVSNSEDSLEDLLHYYKLQSS